MRAFTNSKLSATINLLSAIGIPKSASIIFSLFNEDKGQFVPFGNEPLKDDSSAGTFDTLPGDTWNIIKHPNTGEVGYELKSGKGEIINYFEHES